MKALLVAVLALTGCYFKTESTLVETPVSSPKVSTNIVSSDEVNVVAKTRANVISLRVETRRQCTTQAVQDFEVVRETKPTLGVSIWIIPAGIVFPLAFALVPAITGVVAVARTNKGPRSTESRIISRSSYACALRMSGQVVQVRFPSGAVFEIRTDERGIGSVIIPDEEIDHGTARIELASVSRTIDYDRRSYDLEQLAIVVDE